MAAEWSMDQSYLNWLGLGGKSQMGLIVHFVIGGEASNDRSQGHLRRFSKQELAEAGDKPDFLTLPKSSRYLDATDPRDKVYELLWALDELEIPPPDDSKSVAQVYEEATVSTICRLGTALNSLDPLYWVNGVDRPADLPSWVPNWNCQGRLNRIFSPFDFLEEGFKIMAKDHTDSPPEFSSPGQLKLYGQVLSKVKTATGYLAFESEKDIIPEERTHF